mmetsp:Transcript_31337/g.103740  ORF Transcript_31337/g.103740 Transcript_31337/m.103740 type:complete len:436 (+) Transcript_31337:309-1616(+)
MPRRLCRVRSSEMVALRSSGRASSSNLSPAPTACFTTNPGLVGWSETESSPSRSSIAPRALGLDPYSAAAATGPSSAPGSTVANSASRHGEAAQRTCAFEDARHEPSACTSAGAVGTSASPSRGSNSSRAPIATKLTFGLAYVSCGVSPSSSGSSFGERTSASGEARERAASAVRPSRRDAQLDEASAASNAPARSSTASAGASDKPWDERRSDELREAREARSWERLAASGGPMPSSAAPKAPAGGEVSAASIIFLRAGPDNHLARSRSRRSRVSPPARRASRRMLTSPCLVADRVSDRPSELSAAYTWTIRSSSRMCRTRPHPMPSRARERCSAARARAVGLRCVAQPESAEITRPSETEAAIAASALFASSAMKPLVSALFLMSIGTIRSRSASMCRPSEPNISRKALAAFLASAERSESQNWMRRRLRACS